MGIASILIYLMIVIYFATLWKIFEKAGREKKWEGFVPVYNIVIWLKVINKPWWWVFFWFIPFVNLVIAVAMHVETARMFGKYEAKDTLLTIVCPWYYLPFLAFKDENKIIKEEANWDNEKYREKRTWHDHITLFFMAPFIGHALLIVFKLIGSKRKSGKGSMEYEWTNAIGFAIVAASILRVFSFEAFTIPTGSMEKTMRIGDYLFVNKMKYGARVPMTVVSVPFVHNRIPGTFKKSFVEWVKLDYTRLPGYGEMERGDIMVFNWPVGDSVLLHEAIVAHDFYQICRDEAIIAHIRSGKISTKEQFAPHADKLIKQAKERLINGGGLSMEFNGTPITETKGLQTLPLDKKENYVKRCVGIAGDKLQIIDGFLYINDNKQTFPEEAQFNYKMYGNNSNQYPLSVQSFDEKFDMYMQDVHLSGEISPAGDTLPMTFVTSTISNIEKIRNLGLYDSVVCDIKPTGYNYVMNEGRYCPIYPNHPSIDWTRDNFGPITIPAEGMKVDLTDPATWILYRRVIEAYEYNDVVEVKADGIYIDGTLTKEYTFKQDYYWMMGDNRHGSVDSRFWGFVGEDHIVGTASFVWMSKHPEKGWFSGGLRWDRVFSFVK